MQTGIGFSEDTNLCMKGVDEGGAYTNSDEDGVQTQGTNACAQHGISWMCVTKIRLWHVTRRVGQDGVACAKAAARGTIASFGLIFVLIYSWVQWRCDRVCRQACAASAHADQASTVAFTNFLCKSAALTGFGAEITKDRYADVANTVSWILLQILYLCVRWLHVLWACARRARRGGGSRKDDSDRLPRRGRSRRVLRRKHGGAAN